MGVGTARSRRPHRPPATPRPGPHAIEPTTAPGSLGTTNPVPSSGGKEGAGAVPVIWAAVYPATRGRGPAPAVVVAAPRRQRRRSPTLRTARAAAPGRPPRPAARRARARASTSRLQPPVSQRRPTAPLVGGPTADA